MRQPLVVILGTSALLIAVGTTVSEACTCMLSGPACQEFWQTDAVFDGTVMAIEPMARDLDLGNRTIAVVERLVKLNARQSWKGVDAGRVEVVTGNGGGDCGFEFEVGERYLVFARRGPVDGRLHASICTPTQKFSATSEAARFFDSLTKPSPGGRIFGSVELLPGPLDTSGTSKKTPMALAVRLSGGGVEKTITSTQGRYEFTNLSVAQYRIDLLVPDAYATHLPVRNVEIPHPHACAEESYGLSVNGRVAGQLLLPDGRVAGRAWVELRDADAPPGRQYSMRTPTDDGGYFEFERLPPGRYIVGLGLRDAPNGMSPYDRTIYPGPLSEPETIELPFGGAVQLQPWRVPRLSEATLNGTVVWNDGAPASRIALMSWDVTGPQGSQRRHGESAMTDERGRFSLRVWEGRSYALTASSSAGRLPTDVTQLAVTAGMAPVLVRILSDRPKPQRSGPEAPQVRYPEVLRNQPSGLRIRLISRVAIRPIPWSSPSL